jgi:hypothetical protein
LISEKINQSRLPVIWGGVKTARPLLASYNALTFFLKKVLWLKNIFLPVGSTAVMQHYKL